MEPTQYIKRQNEILLFSPELLNQLFLPVTELILTWQVFIGLALYPEVHWLAFFYFLVFEISFYSFDTVYICIQNLHQHGEYRSLDKMKSALYL